MGREGQRGGEGQREGGRDREREEKIGERGEGGRKGKWCQTFQHSNSSVPKNKGIRA